MKRIIFSIIVALSIINVSFRVWGGDAVAAFPLMVAAPFLIPWSGHVKFESTAEKAILLGAGLMITIYTSVVTWATVGPVTVAVVAAVLVGFLWREYINHHSEYLRGGMFLILILNLIALLSALNYGRFAQPEPGRVIAHITSLFLIAIIIHRGFIALLRIFGSEDLEDSTPFMHVFHALPYTLAMLGLMWVGTELIDYPLGIQANTAAVVMALSFWYQPFKND